MFRNDDFSHCCTKVARFPRYYAAFKVHSCSNSTPRWLIHIRKSPTISSDAGTVYTIVLIIESIFLIRRKRDVRKTFWKICWRLILEVIYG